MTDTHEADRSDLKIDDAVRELFAQMSPPSKDVVWLADQLLGIAQHLGSVTLERFRDEGVHALVCRAGSDRRPFSPGRDALRFFRPLLARFAVLGADETGSEPQLYGGQYALVRSSRTGPVRLEVMFENTPGSQHVAITRIPASAANTAPQPSA